MGGDVAGCCVTQVQGALVQMPWSERLCFILAPPTTVGQTVITVQQTVHIVLSCETRNVKFNTKKCSKINLIVCTVVTYLR